MTNDPVPDSGEPSERDAKTKARRWRHNHASFVLAVLTRYRVGNYKHKRIHTGEIGTGMQSWKPEDETLAIEEGRRQLDSQFGELQYVTTRASVLLTIATAAAIYFLTALDDLNGIPQSWQWIACSLLLSGSASAFWGALVMGALVGDRAPFKRTDIVNDLTNEPGELSTFLARDYAENVPTGVNTNAARLTHLGTGVIWIAVGALLGMVGLLITIWFVPPSEQQERPPPAATITTTMPTANN